MLLLATFPEEQIIGSRCNAFIINQCFVFRYCTLSYVNIARKRGPEATAPPRPIQHIPYIWLKKILEFYMKM